MSKLKLKTSESGRLSFARHTIHGSSSHYIAMQEEKIITSRV